MNTKAKDKTNSKGLQKASSMTLSVSSTVWYLVRLNLLFIIFCVPVITAPAAAAAMTKVLVKISKGEDADLWRVYWPEFKADFFMAFKAGLIIVASAAAVGVIGYLMMQLRGFVGAMGIAFIIVFGLWLYTAVCYLFVLMTTVKLSLKNCLRNAVLLAILEPKQNLMLMIPLVLMIACVLLFPISLPLLLFVMFSLSQLIVCTVTGKVIQKRIIAPYKTHSVSQNDTAKI